jgi:hypothetical protein
MEHFYKEIDGWATFEDQGILLNTILDNLVNKTNINIAEIGVYKGRGTSLWVVELINKKINFNYYAIDHFMGSEEHDKSINYLDITKKNLKPIINNIKLIQNDSIIESKNYDDNFFDIVYIDASHDYESVKKDIISWIPKVKPGGIICGDDYTEGWIGVMEAVDEIFTKPKLSFVGKQQWYHIK